MGIYDPNRITESYENEINMEELLETYIYTEIRKLPDEERVEFVQSEAANGMVQKGLIGKKTLVKLSKMDDLERRVGQAALQIAKDKNDPLFHKLAKIRDQERDVLNKINKKYEAQATRAAKIGQKDYLKNKMPVGFFRR